MHKRRRTFILLGLPAALLLTGIWWQVAAQRTRAELLQVDPESILVDDRLRRAAIGIGAPIFARECAVCHGAAGAGDHSRAAPDLTDGDQLYGSGNVAEIEQIVLHGIRSGDPKGWNLASMPAYASARPYAAEPIPPLRPGEITDLVAYLRALHGDTPDQASVARGKALYAGKGGCYDCHASDAAGDPAIGAPNLLDDVWLFGDGSPDALRRTIAGGRHGIMPSYIRRMSAADARAVAVYAASLGKRNREESR